MLLRSSEAWWLGVLEALRLGVSKAWRFLVLSGAPGRRLGAPWELLDASWELLRFLVASLGGRGAV